MPRRLATFVVVALAVVAGAPSWAETITLHLRQQPISAELARSPEAQARGLMHRTHLGKHSGMLFVFDRDGKHCMWMKNTLLPLSVAFLDSRGVIVTLAEMQPGSLELHCAARPALYALEMNAGWFARHGGRAGGKIDNLPR